MVNSDKNFEDHPFVINGFNELMADIFGEDNGIGVGVQVWFSREYTC